VSSIPVKNYLCFKRKIMDEPALSQGVATFIWIIGGIIGFIAAVSIVDIIKTNRSENKE